MFGRYYASRDADLLSQKQSREEYAIELLTELLNRSLPLAGLHIACIEEEEGPAQQEKLETLAAAVEGFLRDVEETRARGARARLFSRGDFGTVDDACVDGSDLADLGGSLVPWHEDEPAPVQPLGVS